MGNDNQPETTGELSTGKTLGIAATTIGSRALKWGAITAGVVAAAAFVLTGPLAIPAAGILSSVGLGSSTLAATGGFVLEVAKWGAIVGGAVGALKGAADVPDKLEDAREVSQDQADRQMALTERRELLNQRRRAMAMSTGAPGAGVPNPGMIPGRGQSASRDF